ncbi:hypothetical protein OPV22_018358 [Ensete ventricosum]|uniref:Protein kinase domain-containing protein n=1 Tax=Ensete ventricosum TaxID=4639 RepID=A0AAV8QYH1_ENSVE|nr:hypothetical protein OPV22_018358 [Ensete ventricosum]
MRGTKEYMAPEWALNRPITAEVDVYGQLLRRASSRDGEGRRVSDRAEADGKEDSRSLVAELKEQLASGDASRVGDVVDRRLNWAVLQPRPGGGHGEHSSVVLGGGGAQQKADDHV